MNKFDVQISNNMWAFARKLELEAQAAAHAARAYDVKHDLPWPCNMPAVGGTIHSICGSRELCAHVD